KAPEAGDGDRPGVVHEVEALDRREPVAEPPDDALQQLRRVPHPVEAVATLVDDDRVELFRDRDPRLGLREHHARDRPFASCVNPNLRRHAPALAALARRLDAVRRLGEIHEALLAQDELASLEPRTDEGVARLEDPAVHYLRDRLARCLAERRPQIAGVRVAVRVPPEIVADAVTEEVGAEVLLEHREY